MKLIVIIALASGLGSAVGLVWILAGIIRHGRFTVIEPCTPWLWCEMGLVVMAAVCCLTGLIYMLVRGKKL
jgi:hypothetical protein